LSVAVVGYRTDTFPAFYLRDSGQRVPWRVESAAEIAAAWRARHGMGTDGYGLVVANPVPLDAELDRELHDRTVTAGGAGAPPRARPMGMGRTSLRSSSSSSIARQAASRWPRTSPSCGTTRAWRLPSPSSSRAIDMSPHPHVVCVGDVMADIVARLPGPLAP